MSGALRSLGRVFKKIGKIALPILAIGAVVLTGGAALGALPALGSMVGKLGLSKVLSGIVVSAAKGATFGAVGALVTGKDPIKGATSGLLAGAAFGGIGAALGGLGAKAAVAGQAATAGNTAAQVGQVGAQAAQAGAATSGAASAAGAAASAVPAAASIIPASAVAAAPAAGIGGGIGGFIGSNPMVSGMLIQGIGSGLSASAQLRERRREEDRIRDNYRYDGLGTGTGASFSSASQPYITLDPTTGLIVNRRREGAVA